MKKFLILALAVGLAMVLIPAATGAGARDKTQEPAAPREPSATAPQATDDTVSDPAGEESVAVFMNDTKTVETLPLRDYVISAVAGEMPAVYEPQALMAQALASVTLVRYLQARGAADESLAGAVVSTDPARHQAYMSVQQMRERWGENFEEYYKKLCDAVDAVLPYTITYGGAPIMAVFHAVSPGVTETAETLWGKAIPYLVNCESAGDKLSPGYASRAVFSPEELALKLDLPAADAAPETWLGEGTYSDAGTLLQIAVCGKSFTGFALRQALSLRSAAITPAFDGENFVFSVKGYGHGAGLSQYGADYYARQGMDCREIIAHYYPGTKVERLGA